MANEEIEISELEYTEEVAPDNLIPIESATDTKATSLQVLRDWFKSFFVSKTGDEEIGGVKTFNDTTYFAKNRSNIVLSGGEGGKELGEIIFSGNNDYPNGTHLDRYENCLRIFGEHDQTKTHAVLTTLSINKSSNAIGLKLGNGIIINSLVMASQCVAYTWKIPFTNENYIVVTTTTSGTNNFTRTTTTISCNDFNHGETSKPSNVMAIAIGY